MRSLACVLYECLTGRPPFDAATTTSMMKAHLFTEPPTLRSAAEPTAMDQVIQRAMAKDPELRFGSPTALAAAARQALQGTVDPQTRRLAAAAAGSGRPESPTDEERSVAQAPTTLAGQQAQGPDRSAPTTPYPEGGGQAGHGGAPPGDVAVGAQSHGSSPQHPTSAKQSNRAPVMAVVAAVVVVALGLGAFLLFRPSSGGGGSSAGASSSATAAAQGAAGAQQSDAGGGATDTKSSSAPSARSSAASTPVTAAAVKTSLTNLTAQPEAPDQEDGDTIAGKSYSTVLLFRFCLNEGQDTFRWALGGKYKSLTFWTGQVDSGPDQDTSGSLTFSGDGKNLGQSGQMKVGDAPKKITLNVTGVNQLTVKVPESTEVGNCHLNNMAMADATLTGASD